MDNRKNNEVTTSFGEVMRNAGVISTPSPQQGVHGFADTPKGAKANAVLYTLVESAQLNELDVYTYLKYLLTEMLNNHHPENPEIIDNYLPWSATLPQECKLNYKNKKCLKL